MRTQKVFIQNISSLVAFFCIFPPANALYSRMVYRREMPRSILLFRTSNLSFTSAGRALHFSYKSMAYSLLLKTNHFLHLLNIDRLIVLSSYGSKKLHASHYTVNNITQINRPSLQLLNERTNVLCAMT